jgi:hypothetical protein
MIDVHYVTTNMLGKCILTGLEVAQGIGGAAVTVQPPGMFSEEKAVVSVRGRNISIVDTEYIGAKEHAKRLYDAIMGLKGCA